MLRRAIFVAAVVAIFCQCAQASQDELVEEPTEFIYRERRNIINPDPNKTPHAKHGEFIHIGRTTKIHCLPDGSLVTFKAAKFVWTDGDNRPLESPRFTKLANGTLQIKDVQPEDSDKYTCAVQYVKSDDTPVLVTYEHQLWTFTMPVSKVVSKMVYDRNVGTSKNPMCDDKAAKKKAKEIQTVLCKDYKKQCPYRARGDCSYAGEGKDKKATGLTVHVYTSVGTFTPPNCVATCIKDATEMHLVKHFDKVEALSMAQAKTLPLTTQKKNQLRYQEKSFDTDFKHTCPGGYRPFTITCLPCPPGTYNTPGNKECILCPKNHYQNKYAMAECYQCPDNKLTADYGSYDVAKCKEKGEFSITLDMTQSRTRSFAMIAGWVSLVALLICGAMISMKVVYDQRKNAAEQKNMDDDPDMKDLHEEIRKAISKSYQSTGSGSVVGVTNEGDGYEMIDGIYDVPPAPLAVDARSDRTNKSSVGRDENEYDVLGTPVERRQRSRSSVKQTTDDQKGTRRAASAESVPKQAAPPLPYRDEEPRFRADDPYLVPRTDELPKAPKKPSDTKLKSRRSSTTKQSAPVNKSSRSPERRPTTRESRRDGDRSSTRDQRHSTNDETMYYTPQATPYRESIDGARYATPPEGRLRHSIHGGSPSRSPERPLMRDTNRRSIGMDRVMLANVTSLPHEEPNMALYTSLLSSTSVAEDPADAAVTEEATDNASNNAQDVIESEHDWVSVSTRESAGSLTGAFTSKPEPEGAVDKTNQEVNDDVKETKAVDKENNATPTVVQETVADDAPANATEEPTDVPTDAGPKPTDPEP